MTKPPTPSETQALQILWDRGEATVPELHQEICKSGDVGYTTVLKRMQRMEDKGLVTRISSAGRAHTFKAVMKPGAARKGLVNKLIATAFDNSPHALIQHAIGEHKLSTEDIDEIRSLLDRVEAGRAKGSQI